MINKIFKWSLLILGFVLIISIILLLFNYGTPIVDGYRNTETGECIVTSYSWKPILGGVKEHIPENYVKDVDCRNW